MARDSDGGWDIFGRLRTTRKLYLHQSQEQTFIFLPEIKTQRFVRRFFFLAGGVKQPVSAKFIVQTLFTAEMQLSKREDLSKICNLTSALDRASKIGWLKHTNDNVQREQYCVVHDTLLILPPNCELNDASSKHKAFNALSRGSFATLIRVGERIHPDHVVSSPASYACPASMTSPRRLRAWSRPSSTRCGQPREAGWRCRATGAAEPRRCVPCT